VAGEERALRKICLLVIALSLVLFLSPLSQDAFSALTGPYAEPARPIKTVRIYFRAEEYYWTNGTYTIWPANTSAPEGEALTWTFSCTAYNQYGNTDVWTGGVAWVTDPLLGDLYVEGDVHIRVWLNGSSPGGDSAPAGLIAYVADIDETDNVTEYWESDVYILFGGLPSEPTTFSFSIHVDGYTFVAGHRLGFGVVVGSTTYGYMASASFGGQPSMARALVPTTDYARLSSVSIRAPDGQNRTKFYVDEAPIEFEVSVSDPFSNLDVAEVRVLVYNSTHVLLNRTAEAITSRRALTTQYALSWYPIGVAPGSYTAEVSVVDNSGNRDVRAQELKFVLLKVSDWAWTPSWLKRGFDGQELCISFSNGGNDVMYDVIIYVVNSCDIVLEPLSASLGDLGPGEELSLNLTASVPADVELGARNMSFCVEYSDFRGVRHRENLTAEVCVAIMGSSLSLELEPAEARVLDIVSARVELVDELGRPLANMSVEFYVDDQLITSVRTGDDGAAELDLQASFGPGDHVVRAVFGGTELFGPSSAEATLRLRLRNSSLEAHAPEEAVPGSSVPVEAILRGEDGEPIQNATIYLYLAEEGSLRLLAQNKTDVNGIARFSVVLEAGDHELKLVFQGNDIYMGSETTLSVSVRAPGGQSGGGGGDFLVPSLALGAATSVSAAAAVWLKKRRR